jgi:hypothetical protein
MNLPSIHLPVTAFEDFNAANNATVDPLERLAASDRLRGVLRSSEGLLVDLARRQGKTWDDIGDALGISGQAAHQRYSP